MHRIQCVKLGMLAAVILSVGACSKTDNGAADTTSAVTTAAVASNSTGGTPDTHKFGAVQVYVLQDTTNMPDTVDVQTADSAIIVNRNQSPAADTILGKIVNTGTKKEKRYKFKPQSQAVYFLYAQHMAPGVTTGWYITELKHGDKEKPFMHGVFALCDSTTHPPTTANIGFKWCQRFGPRKAQMKTSSLMSWAPLDRLFALAKGMAQDSSRGGPMDGTDDPGWVSCSEGCCTLGNATIYPKQN